MVEYKKRSPTGDMHRSFNEAAAHVDMLRRLIENRKGSDWPIKHLHEMLRKTDAVKEAARDELMRAGVKRL